MFREFAMPCDQVKQQSTNEIYNYMRSTRLQAILISDWSIPTETVTSTREKKNIYIYIYRKTRSIII